MVSKANVNKIHINWTLGLCVKRYIIYITSTRIVASINPFEVIFDHLTITWRMLVFKYSRVERINCINTVFRIESQKILMVTTRTTSVASWYRHDEKLRGQEMSFAKQTYSLELFGMWDRVVETTYSPSRNIHNWPLQPFSQDYGLASHITHVVCVNFICEWWDLQFNVDSKREIFENRFRGRFIYPQSVCQKSAER